MRRYYAPKKLEMAERYRTMFMTQRTDQSLVELSRDSKKLLENEELSAKEALERAEAFERVVENTPIIGCRNDISFGLFDPCFATFAPQPLADDPPKLPSGELLQPAPDEPPQPPAALIDSLP
ncbi:unnamed protein product [Anisakis simplex]|uniref:UVR domain-containing protein n=1 Tax=Anisakis simplex TaxID=6269 RepID=A0A0M3J6Q1_ANISI|nr:unnamed protein product [Anisakis simplex]